MLYSLHFHEDAARGFNEVYCVILFIQPFITIRSQTKWYNAQASRSNWCNWPCFCEIQSSCDTVHYTEIERKGEWKSHGF